MYSPQTIETVDSTLPKFTNKALDEGLFDQLMAAVDGHLDKQYKDGRLRGTQYAEVYVGAISGVLQNTTQFLLGTMLIDEQKAKANAEVRLMDLEAAKVELEKDLLELEKEKLRYEIDELLPLLKLKQQAEIDLIRKQIEKLTAEIAMLVAQEALMIKQGLKLDKEIEFLTAKIRTEEANTIAGIAAAGSLIGKQMSLLEAQKLGFAGDIQVKTAKMYADYDAIVESVNENAEAELSLSAKTAIGKADTTAVAIKGV